MKNPKPNLFIIGAPKCGTTFLFEKLKGHPEIFFPRIKELNHFSYEELKINSYYKDFKIKSREKYLGFYKTAKNQKYLVDGSVSYFTFDDIPSKINVFNPDAKIIIMVRNPYKRAYSHYLMDKRMTYTNKPFMEYLKDPSSFHYKQYISNSRYFEQYKKYQDFFSDQNILIIELENLETEMNKIFSFLKIKPISIDFSKRVNENKVSKNSIGNFAQKNRGFIEQLKLVIPKSIISLLKNRIYKTGEKMQIPEKEFKFLKPLIEKDYSQFNKLIKNEG